MAKNKQPRGKSPKTSAAYDKAERPAEDAAGNQLSDPLRAFPADPPRRNFALMVISAVLFAIWFCFLAYVALRG